MVIFTIIILIIILIAFKYPELAFALFLLAGAYKADPRLSFIPEYIDLTVFFEALTLFVILFKVISGKLKISLPQKDIYLPYIFIITMGVFSLFYTSAHIYGAEKLMRLLFITTPAFFLPAILFKDKKSFSMFFSLLVILSVIMTIDVLSSGGVRQDELAFHSALGSDYLFFGGISGIAMLIMTFFFFLNIKSTAIKLFMISMMPFIQLGAFISGGRTPLIGLVATILFILIYFMKGIFICSIKKQDIRIMTVVILFIVLSAVLIMAFHGFLANTFMRFELLKYLEGDSVANRFDMFKVAAGVITQMPAGLTGLGIGGFSVFYSAFDDKRGEYPHNIFLEIGSELGALALMAFIFILYRAFMLIFSSIKNSETEDVLFTNVTLLACFIFMIINSSVSGDINDNRMLFAVIGLMCAFKNYMHIAGLGGLKK